MNIRNGETLLSRPDNLTTLPSLPRIEDLELLHGTGLHADHPGVLIIREIRHTFSFVAPWVPHSNGVEALPNNRKPRLIRVGVDDGHRRGRVDIEIDAIGLTGDGDGGGRFFLDGKVVGFVGIGLGLEVLDADFVDILTISADQRLWIGILARHTGTLK